MAGTPKPRFVLHLTALPRDNDDDGMRRLRAVLKLLLRGFGFRCTWISYPPSGPADDEYARPLSPDPRPIDGPPDMEVLGR
jgi:hypothetical protein